MVLKSTSYRHQHQADLEQDDERSRRFPSNKTAHDRIQAVGNIHKNSTQINVANRAAPTTGLGLGLAKKRHTRHTSSTRHGDDSDENTTGTYLSSSGSSDDDDELHILNHDRKRLKISTSSEALALLQGQLTDMKDMMSYSPNNGYDCDSSFHSVTNEHWNIGGGDTSAMNGSTDISHDLNESLESMQNEKDDNEIGISALYIRTDPYRNNSALPHINTATQTKNAYDLDEYNWSDLRPIETMHLNRSRSEPMTPRRRLHISLPPNSPIPQYINKKKVQARQVLSQRSIQARKALQNQNLKLKNGIVKYKTYRQKRKAAKRKSRVIVIPSNHRLKVLWDIATIALTFVSAYVGHIYIRDRSTYEWDWFVLFSNVWYFVDLLLNFFTEHRTSDGKVMRSGREVWGRYLTTWFAIDALSLLPWERMFLRPIIQAQKRRHFVVKWFFRSKAVVKVTRILKHRHFRAFGKVANNTKQFGYGAKRLLHLIIKYVPKYVLFYRNMKGVIVLKTLRQIHFAKKIFRSLTTQNDDNYDDDDDECEDDELEEIEDDELEEIEIDCTQYFADDDDSLCSSIIEHDQSQETSFNNEIENFGSYDGFSDDDTISCNSTDAAETDYESCIEDCDYDIHFSIELPD